MVWRARGWNARHNGRLAPPEVRKQISWLELRVDPSGKVNHTVRALVPEESEESERRKSEMHSERWFDALKLTGGGFYGRGVDICEGCATRSYRCNGCQNHYRLVVSPINPGFVYIFVFLVLTTTTNNRRCFDFLDT